MAQTTEVRYECPREEVDVIDGYCHATGRSRTDVIRQVVREWSERKRHEAVCVCRTAGINPLETEANRP